MLAAATCNGNRALPARGTRCWITIACRRLVWFLVSASVKMSPPPEQITAASAGPVKIAKIYFRLKICQMLFRYCRKLGAISMGRLCAALGASSQGQPKSHFEIHPEHPQQHFRDKQQALWKNRTLNHNSPMMPSSCISARCKLAYGTYGGPLYYFYKQKLKKMKNKNYHNCSASVLTTPFKLVFARIEAFVKVKFSDSAPSSPRPSSYQTKEWIIA